MKKYFYIMMLAMGMMTVTTVLTSCGGDDDDPITDVLNGMVPGADGTTGTTSDRSIHDYQIDISFTENMDWEHCVISVTGTPDQSTVFYTTDGTSSLPYLYTYIGKQSYSIKLRSKSMLIRGTCSANYQTADVKVTIYIDGRVARTQTWTIPEGVLMGSFMFFVRDTTVEDIEDATTSN